MKSRSPQGEGSEGGSVPCLSPSFQWLFTIFGIPYLGARSPQPLSLSLHMTFVYLLVSWCSYNILIKTPVISLGTHPN